MAVKFSCQIIARLLVAHGVRRVVVSPGSRNAPLILGIDAEKGLKTHVVIDERSAAFQALGMAQQSRDPVAIICTSGTALLNYAPAVAEGCYQHLPLIVISADRPRQWIDQDDSQTIRQPGVLSNFTKYNCDIPDFSDPEGELAWYCRRCVSDALNAAMEPACGPVHINVQLGEPLTADFPELKKVPAIKQLQAPQLLPLSQLRELAGKARDRKVMVVAGFMTPSERMAKGMAKLAALPNVVVLAESIANIHCLGAFNCVDRILAVVEKDNPAFQPDLVISAGGALVSRHLKSYLRNCRQVEHWSIGMTDGSADVFKHLSLKIKTDPAEFIAGFADALAWSKPEGNYAERWQSLRPLDERRHNALLEASPWSCMRLFAALWPLIPEKTNLQLSNGTCVRYAQLFHNPKIHASYCNRGVSGIDGCTSTAVGSALSYPGQTMLITGDMSFLYDSSPMLYTLPDRLKIIAIDNGGGGIFRFIRTTKNLPLAQREKYFCTDLPHLSEEPNLLARHTCFCAESEEEFLHFLPEFMKHEGPAIFLVKVEPELDARAITDYFEKAL